jgi:hypothetical protein
VSEKGLAFLEGFVGSIRGVKKVLGPFDVEKKDLAYIGEWAKNAFLGTTKKKAFDYGLFDRNEARLGSFE